MDLTRSVAPLPAGVPRGAESFHSHSGITVSYDDQWTRRHVLEEDGLCPLLYQYLHKSIKGRERTLSSVRLPETVVFDHNFPRAWYVYDAENKEITKRSSKMLDAQTMYDYFVSCHERPTHGGTQGGAREGSDDANEVVAQFIYTTVRVEDEWCQLALTGEKCQTEWDGQLLTYVEFFTAVTLHDFLFKRPRKPDGVLQKFVVPRAEGSRRCNAQMQVLWSPLMTTVYRRVNHHRLDDYSIPIAKRCSTYDGPRFYSSESLVADRTKHQLQQLCCDIADHFYSVEHKRITRLVLFFKTDDANKMWLLWASCIRVGADALNPTRFRRPVCFDMRTELINDGCSTVDRVHVRRGRQKRLLALDYAFFEAARDYDFALNVCTSHRRQAEALGMKGLSRVHARPGSTDPRYNSQHALHEAFACVWSDDDASPSRRSSRRPRTASSAAAQARGVSAASDEAWWRPRAGEEVDQGAGDPSRRVQEELCALAMDAWYAVYSATLASTRATRPMASLELAEPLVNVLTKEEVAQLSGILGIVAIPPPSTSAAEAESVTKTTAQSCDGHGDYRVSPVVLGPGRRLDAPSAQVEQEVAEFFVHLFQRRGEAVTRECIEKYAFYFS